MATNNIFTVAGTGAQGFSGDGEPATAAQLSNPIEVSVTASARARVVVAVGDQARD